MPDEDVLAGIEIPDPLPLRNITTPPEVSRVDGCDCGGTDWHRAPEWNHPGCSIWQVPHEQAMAAIDTAHRREKAYTDALNAKLRAAPGHLS